MQFTDIIEYRDISFISERISTSIGVSNSCMRQNLIERKSRVRKSMKRWYASVLFIFAKKWLPYFPSPAFYTYENAKKQRG